LEDAEEGVEAGEDVVGVESEDALRLVLEAVPLAADRVVDRGVLVEVAGDSAFAALELGA
jgi:hypothetical protein